MNEGLGMDPNPSSFLPLIFVLYNSTNLSSIAYIAILVLVSYHPLLTAVGHSTPPNTLYHNLVVVLCMGMSL